MKNNTQLVDCVKVYNMIHTLEGLVEFLNENVMDEKHVLRTEMIDTLSEQLQEFEKLKVMLEECIDIGKARHNDYMINPEFSPELKELSKMQNGVRKQLEVLRQQV